MSNHIKSSTFDSSENLYHRSLLWKEEVSKTVDHVSDTASTLASSDDVISLDKSLFAVLNTELYEGKYCGPRVKIYGHRGSLYTEPENTVKSFLDAARLGADGVELDVFLTKCGTLIVFHGDGGDLNPGTLDDYCGIQGQIEHLTLDEAKQLAFYAGADVYPCPLEKLSGAVIPTLKEVLLAVPPGFEVKIELKGHGTEFPSVELVQRLNMMHQCTFSSFHHDRIDRIRNIEGVRTGALFENHVPFDFVDRAKAVGASEIHLRYDTCTKERVRAIHDHGLISMAWFCGPRTMKKEAEHLYWDVGNEDAVMYQAVLNTGVQGMCVNRPDVLVYYTRGD